MLPCLCKHDKREFGGAKLFLHFWIVGMEINFMLFFLLKNELTCHLKNCFILCQTLFGCPNHDVPKIGMLLSKSTLNTPWLCSIFYRICYILFDWLSNLLLESFLKKR